MQKTIKEYLSHVKGSAENKSYEFLKLLKDNSMNGEKALKDLFELSEITDSDETNEINTYISEDHAEMLFSKYSQYVLSYLKLLIESKPSVNSFYKQLWLFIDKDPFLQTLESKSMALALVWYDYRLPYYVFEQKEKMGDVEFSEIYDRIALKISKARFVIYSYYELKTQRAADLIKILDELEDEKEKQVLLALALVFNERKAKSTNDKK